MKVAYPGTELFSVDVATAVGVHEFKEGGEHRLLVRLRIPRHRRGWHVLGRLEAFRRSEDHLGAGRVVTHHVILSLNGAKGQPHDSAGD